MNKPPSKNLNYSLVLITLSISMFAAQSFGVLNALLLVDISETFATPLGITAQIMTFSAALGVIGAMLMSVFSVRFSKKSLLMIGSSLSCIAALGCFFAPTLEAMFITYSVSGLGLAIVAPMAYALLGDLFSIEKRSFAVGILVASISLSYVLSAPIISIISSSVGWRLTFVGYILFLNLLALISTKIVIPSRKFEPQNRNSSLFEGLKQVLNNKSAIACLIGVLVVNASWQAVEYYAVSFYRDVFQVPTTWAAISVSGIALIFVCGSILGGKIVDKYGRKRLTIISTTLMGLFIILYLNASDFFVSLFLSIGASFFGSILLTAYNNLNLEQLPNFRGTMMSLEIVAASIGVSLGAAIGGMTLLWFNWSMLGIVLGLIGVIASIVYLLFTVDPIQANTS